MQEDTEAITILIESKINSKVKILGVIASLKGGHRTDYEILSMADLANKIYEKFTKE